jgi:hypothetical protein
VVSSRPATVFRCLDVPREPDEAEAADALAIARQLYERVSKVVAEGEAGEPDGDNEKRASPQKLLAAASLNGFETSHPSL